jgi:putative oxidoreductase
MVVGLFTRPVAFVLSGTMAGAYFYTHLPIGFFPLLNGGELTALYCFVFLYFSAAGGGAWSLDQYRAQRN